MRGIGMGPGEERCYPRAIIYLCIHSSVEVEKSAATLRLSGLFCCAEVVQSAGWPLR